MEQEHPIPQQISSYQFRLVGDMTLKQFFQVAGGALVALLIYSSTLPSFVKWPLVITSFLFGIALAFFPIGDRPLSKWIFLFIKTIYSPTLYVWKHLETKPVFFQAEPELSVPITPPSLTTTIKPKALAETPELKNLEKKEVEFLGKISRQLALAASFIQTRFARPGQETPEEFPFQRENLVIVPKETPAKIQPQEPQTTPPEFIEAPAPPSFEVFPMQGQKTATTGAKFSLDAAPPVPPTKPNIIVGQVVDQNGKIVEGAILEVRDSEGRAVRALKTNRLGHFMIVTPLADGKYEIITEKEGLVFEPIAIEAKDTIIPPIAIWAKK